MTATTSSPTHAWTQQLEQLRGRYRHLRPAVLAALNILIQDENITVDDAKARADLHGVRIAAASMNAARTVLSRMDAQTTASSAPAAGAPASPSPSPERATRRARAAEAPLDAEALIRGVVTKLQTQGNVETERLRDGIRMAIAALQATLGSP
jgi:hypothetical protein